jgi:ubiquinone/menaquinone biosynthesis C-methylase UbiE
MTSLQTDVYGGTDSRYDAFSKAHAYRLEAPQRVLRTLIRRNQLLNVLDIGGGSGILVEPFLKRARCCLLEMSRSLALQAQEKGIPSVVGDIECGLPLRDRSMDVIVCSHTLEHIVRTDQLLSEMNRVLKPGGNLILTLPNVNQPVSWLMMIFCDLPPKHSSRYKGVHVRDFTLRTIKRAVEINGFHVKRVQGSRVAPFYRSKLSELVARLLPRLSDDQTLLCTRVAEPLTTPVVVEDVREIFTSG